MLPHLQDERNLVPPKIKDAQNFCGNHACMFFREPHAPLRGVCGAAPQTRR